MADQFDRASELEELHRQQSIQAALLKSRELRPVGRCHNCLDQVDTGQLFCNADCSADHEHRLRMQRH